MTDPLDAIDWPVRTQRLTIRRYADDDLDAIWQLRRLDEVNEWLTTRPETFEEFVSHRDAERAAKTLIIELDGAVIGDLFISVRNAFTQSEVADVAKGAEGAIGWALRPEHSGQGYATEAAAKLLELCFADLGLRRVVAVAYADNIASWRLMERLGMRREAYNVGSALHRSAGWIDAVEYAILADEWRSRHV